MGVIFKLKTIKSLTNYSNKVIKLTFYSSLVFWGNQENSWHPNITIHLLGKRNKISVLNPDHQIEMLKRTTKFSYEVARTQGSILFINNPLNSRFDGLVKAFSFRSDQPFFIEKWKCGSLTKKTILSYSSLVMFNPQKNPFSIKEANKLGIPLISLSNVDSDLSRTMYPILCNNLQGDSLFFNSYILCNAMLEGKLYKFIKERLAQN